jgi:lipopolysaccharide transport system ATP-binding protein
MSDIILKIENVSKQYRLGVVGTGTLSHDLNRWWYQLRGKEDPYLKIGDTNKRDTKGDSDYVWALKDINFEVKKGEVLGIIGKNGAGKSTLLKILSQVTAPTTGSIKSKGRIASLLEVGTGFHPELTGKENIYLNGAILGMSKAEIAAKYDEIVEFSGVVRYVDTPVKRYSSGMKVRLAFAVAAHLEPEILVIDEVLAVGDAEFQKKAIGKMQDISKEGGRTVLFVSHDMNAIKNLCNKTILLSSGTIKTFDFTDKVLDLYLSENVLSFNENQKEGFEIKNLKFIINNKDVNVINVFQKFEIVGEISSKNFIPNDIKIELFIKNQFNQVITSISSWLNAINISPTSNNFIFKIFIKNGLSLSAGNYTIDLRIFVHKQIDFIEIFNFELINDDFTGYKYPLKPHIHGLIYTPNEWLIINI